MKRNLFLILCIALISSANAQISGTTFGVVRNNYYSDVIDPFDSTFIYQQLDSTSIRLGKIDHSTGTVTPIGPELMNESVNLTGAALNPYDSTYIFMGASEMLTLSLIDGEVLNRVTISNPLDESYFENFRFNNSDSTLYGLARRFYTDPITSESYGEVYLAKINTTTGIITQISSESVVQGYALAGSAINPYEMVFYFSTGSNLIGLDLYSGEVYRNLPIQNFDGIAFDNFSYSCSDTALYGLIRKNYFSTEFDSIVGFPIETLDSATVRLGKINLTTGEISIVSPYSILSGGYSLNAGSTIDPSTDTYYFSNGYELIGVNIYTGQTTTNPNLNYEEGMYFDLMRNFGDCRNALRIRQNPISAAIGIVNTSSELQLFPNPANEFINLNLDPSDQLISITDLTGKTIASILSNGNTQIQIPVNQLKEGMYLISVDAKQHAKLVVKH
jgi:hypothetical protein